MKGNKIQRGETPVEGKEDTRGESMSLLRNEGKEDTEDVSAARRGKI